VPRLSDRRISERTSRSPNTSDSGIALPIGNSDWFKGLLTRLLQSRCVTLGERITARRRALGWSQNELARRADVNHPTLYKIEAEQRQNPSISVVVRIARALGTSAEVLYGLEREDTRLFVEANKASMVVEVRPLGRKLGEATRNRVNAFVAAALERAGARVRDVSVNGAGDDASESRSLAEAGQLATGGLALVEELQAMRRRLEALEAWRRSQEARARKRASR
jgi:transcriptional regulator with XRE-family HTH domain